MDIQRFLDYVLEKDQKIVSIMGPSGAGKTFSAQFLEDYLNYRVVKQLTTRNPRPDDKHYKYLTPKEFVTLQERGEIFGFFDGDRATFDGRGYGYLKEDVLKGLEQDKKLILFPSAYELETPNFSQIYGTTNKIGLGFKNPRSVIERAIQSGKVMSQEEICSRVQSAGALTYIMEKYAKSNEDFNLIYSDEIEKKCQIERVVDSIGENPEELKDEIEYFVTREGC